jgi:arsenite-transporting ATPase
VVANRVFPAAGADDWRAGWVLAQDEVLAEADASFPGMPVWRSVYRPREPVGVPALVALAEEVYAGHDPLAVPTGAGPFRVTRTAEGAIAHLALPGAARDQVHLGRNGDDLVVTVGSYRRLLTLPAGLARLQVAGARVEQGELQVRFREREPADETGEEQP